MSYEWSGEHIIARGTAKQKKDVLLQCHLSHMVILKCSTSARTANLYIWWGLRSDTQRGKT
jgi:hypothetical protein